jgi:hypothetical protein
VITLDKSNWKEITDLVYEILENCGLIEITDDNFRKERLIEISEPVEASVIKQVVVN